MKSRSTDYLEDIVMEILIFFLLSLGAGEALSADVPQPSWSYEPQTLVFYPERVPLMCETEGIIGEVIPH